jgi:hypothetical protein
VLASQQIIGEIQTAEHVEASAGDADGRECVVIHGGIVEGIRRTALPQDCSLDLNQGRLGNQVGTHGLVLAAPYLDSSGPVVPGVGADSIESDSVQMKKMGRAQLKRALRIEKISNQLDYSIELS